MPGSALDGIFSFGNNLHGEAQVYKVGIAYLLWLFSGFGALGFHRFYLNKPVTGVLWIMTGGLGMVGSAYDFFTLPNQVREANIRAEVRKALDMGARGSLAARFGYTAEDRSEYRQKESLERTILRVAKKNAGLATPSEVALESEATIENARAALDKLASKGFAELRVRKSGAIVYAFPEFMSDDSPFEDF